MPGSLLYVYDDCQRIVDPDFFHVYRGRMAQPDDEKQALGRRLASARSLAGYTMEGVAKALTERGFPIGKAAVGAWEVGRNLPDALWLKRLAKLYGTTLDALVWDEAITMEAIRFAAQYDALNDKQQRAFKAMWLAYFEQAISNEEVEAHLPVAPTNANPASRKSNIKET